jgi:hypothetical protein
MREHQSRWLFMSALFALLATVAGCTRHVYVSTEMSWECAPEHHMAAYPEGQTVRVTFVEAPRYQEEVSGRGLCNQLKVAGKRTFVVEYDTWGNSHRGLISYREVSVDGKPKWLVF